MGLGVRDVVEETGDGEKSGRSEEGSAGVERDEVRNESVCGSIILLFFGVY